MNLRPPSTDSEKSSISVEVNDQHNSVPNGTSVQQLVEQLKLRGGPIAVELNLQIVTASQYESTILREGDQLEIVSLTGGG